MLKVYVNTIMHLKIKILLIIFIQIFACLSYMRLKEYLLISTISFYSSNYVAEII